jgi:hypothetical protein
VRDGSGRRDDGDERGRVGDEHPIGLAGFRR